MRRAEVLSTNVLHRYRIFAIVEQALRLPSDRTVLRQVVKHPGAVVIIPQLEDGRLILIEQYRFAVSETLLEFPAGTLEPGEAPLDCARRELIEETGYRAEHWRALGIMYPSPGYCDETQHLFVASGLVPDHAAGDDDEILEVKRLTSRELERTIADGAMVDAKSIACRRCDGRCEVDRSIRTGEDAGDGRRTICLDPRGSLLCRGWDAPVGCPAAEYRSACGAC
jgi:ADP-ribose pyrophosphatase